MSNQEFNSKDTSVNSVSVVFTHIEYPKKSVILDYGGGKFDSNMEYMKNKGCKVLVYDPYNRTEKHNAKVVKYFKEHPAKFVTLSNVLNVIKEENIILEVLSNIKSVMASDGVLYIKVYERDKNNIGCRTTKGWQRNEKTKEYYKFIEMVFGPDYKIERVKKGNGVISVRRNP